MGFKSASVIMDWLAPLEVDPEALKILRPAVGQTITKRVRLISSLPRVHQKAAAELLNEKALSDSEARRIVAAIKQHPTDDTRKVVEMAQRMPTSVSILSPHYKRYKKYLVGLQDNILVIEEVDILRKELSRVSMEITSICSGENFRKIRDYDNKGYPICEQGIYLLVFYDPKIKIAMR